MFSFSLATPFGPAGVFAVLALGGDAPPAGAPEPEPDDEFEFVAWCPWPPE